MEPTKDLSLTTPALKRTASSAGSSKSGDPAKIQEALARIKAKKEENAADSVSGKTPTTPALGNNSSRKQLQSWRAKSRENSTIGGEDDLRRSAGRQGPRSPLKSTSTKSRLRGKSFAGDEDIGEEDEDDDDDLDKENDEEQEEEVYVPIMQIHAAEHVFPLSIMPKSRTAENELQHVVVVPSPYVAVSDLTNMVHKCVKTTQDSCRCFECCGTATLLSQDLPEIVHHERDFLGGVDNFSLFKWAESQKVTSPELQTFQELLSASEQADGAAGGAPHQQRDRSYDDDQFDETDSLFDVKAARVDGLFNGNPPLLTNMLLDAEHVPMSIAKLSASNLQLSRATQRILRDLLGSIEAQQVRKKWREMTRRVGAESTATGPQRADVPAEVNLLRQLNSAPVLQIIENPVTGGTTQPLIPKESVLYGGQISQWGTEGSVTDKIGALPRGWSGRKGGQRAKFKLHLHQLMFTDHPVMSDEERQLVHLKALYAQYRSLFEQKVLEFLTQRLMSLTSELAQAVPVHLERELDAEELVALRGIYRDVVETLPALNKLNDAVDSLSSNVYEGWREIQDLRLRSGIVHTTAELTVRRVKSNMVASAGAGGSARLGRRAVDEQVEDSGAEDSAGAGAGATPGAGVFWNNLKKNLQETPNLLKRAQEILFKEVPGEEEEVVERPPDTARGSEFGGSQVAMRANEEQRARQAALSRVITVVTAAVDQLVLNNGLIPRFALRLSETGTVTPDNQITVAELKRRTTLKNIRVKAVLKFNGKVVTSTDYHSIKLATMSVDFNKYFEFRVLHQPTDVTLDIYTSKVNAWDPTDTFLATVSVPFPAQVTNGARSGTGKAAAGPASEGARHQHVTHSYTPSSGWYSFTSQLADMSAVARRAEGAVLCTAEYDVSALDHSQNITDGIRPDDLAVIPAARPSLKSVTSARDGTANDFTRETDFQVLLPELDDIDVNDPDNDHLLQLKSKRLAGDDNDMFRLSGAEFGTVFTTEDGHFFNNYVRYKETPRMKLLQLRCVKPYLFNGPIPLNETIIKHSELYKTIFTKELHETMARIGGGDKEDPAEQLTSGKVSINTAKVANFLQRVRSSHTALSRKKKKKNFVTSSVVVETDYITLEELQFVDLFERKRSLRPKVKVRAPLSVQVDKCELLVQVVGAKNIPLRTEHDGMATLGGAGAGAGAGAGGGGSGTTSTKRRPRSSSGAGAGGAPEDEPVVSEHMLDERKMKEKRRARTFVEVKFQENTVATAAMDGGTPMWRQSLSLPFRAPQDDFSPSSLEQVREHVYFTLFDEVEEDDSERGGLLEGESTIRVEKRYLGSFAVPFETIYTEGRIEGVFRIDTPAINFGYDHAASGVTNRRRENGNMFESAEDADADKAAGGAGAAAGGAAGGTGGATEGAWSMFMRLLECLSQTHSQMMLKHPDDSLYYSGSHIHKDTQSEFSYFATDDSATYVKVMITLDPVLTSTPNVVEEISLSNMLQDDRALGAYARTWLKSVKATGTHTESRNYKLFGTNSNGYNVFLCRYLTAQQPPKGYESRRACVHLISNIPFMNDAQSFLGEMDLWCTSSQFWEIGAGDEEEHGVTLFNYLYYLSLKRGTIAQAASAGASAGAGAGNAKTSAAANSAGSADDVLRESVFLVMGKAVPEGDSVYVMMRDHKRASPYAWGPENFLIINPWTGYIYSAVDPNCPLRDVYLLATPNNVWANLQVQSRPAEMSFDLSNLSAWRPFFGLRFPLPKGGLNTVQTDIEYIQTSPGYALEIEKAIFQSIRNRIRKWRSKRQRSTTTFHPDACAVMHDILPKLENWKRCGNPEAFESNEHSAPVPVDQHAALVELQRLAHDKMKNLLRTRTLRGFPLNVPFTDVEELLTRIKTMCIHEAKHPEVQFVMAVRAFPLYNNILSLWVFLGTLEPVAH